MTERAPRRSTNRRSSPGAIAPEPSARTDVPAAPSGPSPARSAVSCYRHQHEHRDRPFRALLEASIEPRCLGDDRPQTLALGAFRLAGDHSLGRASAADLRARVRTEIQSPGRILRRAAPGADAHEPVAIGERVQGRLAADLAVPTGR